MVSNSFLVLSIWLYQSMIKQSSQNELQVLISHNWSTKWSQELHSAHPLENYTCIAQDVNVHVCMFGTPYIAYYLKCGYAQTIFNNELIQNWGTWACADLSKCLANSLCNSFISMHLQ